MLKIREYPDKGALYCEIISKAYLNRFKYKESEMLEVLNMERSTYYDRKKEAILLFTMGYFSEMALNKQEELGLPAEQVPAGDAFEDEETFDELPVPSASRSAASPAVETPPSPAFDADDGAEELAEMNGDDASEAANTDGDDAGKEQEAPAKADASRWFFRRCHARNAGTLCPHTAHHRQPRQSGARHACKRAVRRTYRGGPCRRGRAYRPYPTG